MGLIWQLFQRGWTDLVTDIISNEVIHLGAKRFVRIGAAGYLQPQWIKTGDVVITTGAVPG